ncbi:hydrolase [Oryctes borbonicus]|uniref:Lipid droplet-associated hydrolase n=1 Tax=Oryctes borbonicus TaxID=1629725 RepID=A0A0T6AX84_9SCAR|nr:hydrolase [Oryctes borbonicus]
MQTEWVTVNQVPTKVITWGKTLQQANEGPTEDNLDYIILITGNPGVVNAYEEFLEEIHKKTGFIVWGIGHAGHNKCNSIEMPPYDENKELYGLEGQIKHKITFIEEYVPKNARITLIGHSIGSYIIVKLLGVPSIQSKVVKSFLLFPTIEYIGDSENGKKFTKFIPYLFRLLLVLSTLFNLLPLLIQNFLLHAYLKISGISSRYIEAIRDFVDPFTINNSLNMAMQEMSQMKERDNDIIMANINKIKIYYGADDGWCPITNYFNIKRDIPNIDALVCDKGYSHAFIVKHSLPMARLVVDWMKL